MNKCYVSGGGSVLAQQGPSTRVRTALLSRVDYIHVAGGPQSRAEGGQRGPLGEPSEDTVRMEIGPSPHRQEYAAPDGDRPEGSLCGQELQVGGQGPIGHWAHYCLRYSRGG